MKHAASHGNRARRRRSAHAATRTREYSVMHTTLGVIVEVLFTLAAVCALYLVWQMWWTGVEAEAVQAEDLSSVDWVDPTDSDEIQIAEAQEGDPPVQPESAEEGDLIAQIYIPRFGDGWVRNIVEGTTTEQLNQHGLGHYSTSQMPGELGNFAVAGHRSGYGEPLSYVDTLEEGDVIIVRTADYWYVYTYTTYEIVTPDETDVISANPEDPGSEPTKYMITLTTCHPKYTFGGAKQRWISYGELEYWAYVSDGIPEELADIDESGSVVFVSNDSLLLTTLGSSLVPVIIGALVAYLVIFLAAAAVWRWPVLKEIREGKRAKPEFSIYGGFLRYQPGVLAVRILLLVLVIIAVAAMLLEWAYPWLAANVPILQELSNYAVV